jgi:hypothetical protein
MSEGDYRKEFSNPKYYDNLDDGVVEDAFTTCDIEGSIQ